MEPHPNIGSRKLAQVALVVRDIESAITKWADLLGVEKPEVMVTDPGSMVRMTYRGKATNDQAKLAFFDLGGVQLELIEPIGTDNAWSEGLEQNGEGFHHLAFCVEGMDQSTAFLDERGIPQIHRGDMGEGQFAYYDGRSEIGVMLELLERKREV